MKATIDREGRIALDLGVQQQLGVQPGDEVVLEPRGAELVIKAANGKTGPCTETNGGAQPVAAEEAEIMEDAGPIRLPPRDLRALKAKVMHGPRRRLSQTTEE